MAYSERLERVLGEPSGILAGVSGQKAAIRVAHRGGTLSPAAIIQLKKGLYGREDTLRTLGLAYSPELLKEHGDEIEAVFGERSEPSAAEWLVYISNPRLANVRRTQAGSDTESPRTEEQSTSGSAVGMDLAQIALRAAQEAYRLQLDPMEWYHRRLGALIDLCRQLGVEPMLADFYGGEQGQVQSHEDADQVADALVRDQMHAYPEHAERFRELLQGEG